MVDLDECGRGTSCFLFSQSFSIQVSFEATEIPRLFFLAIYPDLNSS
jgi:hypothetical protein